jgi:drug/metabolite transporter (DMT)-like permease
MIIFINLIYICTVSEMNTTNDLKQIKNASTSHKFKGFFLVMVSGFFMSIQNYFMRKAEFFNAIEQTSFRYLFQIMALSLIACYFQIDLCGTKEFRLKLLIRGLFGTLALIFLNISVKLISPSDTIALFFSQVIIVSILARIFFKEKINISTLLALVFMIIGILLISKPSFLMPKTDKHMNATNISNGTYPTNELTSNIYLFGVASALIAACFSSGSAIMQSQLAVSNVHFSVVILFASYVGFPVSLAISGILFLTKNEVKNPNQLNNFSYLSYQILFAFLSALTGCIHQIALNNSYRFEDASKISIFRTLDLIFSFLMQYLLLNIHLDSLSLFG